MTPGKDERRARRTPPHRETAHREAAHQEAKPPDGSRPKSTLGDTQGGEPGDTRESRYVLRLYVAGVTSASARAVERVRAICEEHLQNRYELEVIDIYQLPALTKGEQILATPTLVRVLPAPLRRYIGDLSREKILFGLDLREKDT